LISNILSLRSRPPPSQSHLGRALVNDAVVVADNARVTELRVARSEATSRRL